MRLARRQVLQALGVGAAAGLVRGEPIARAAPTTYPSRIVFYVQPHGHIPNAWKMDIPGGPIDKLAQRSLVALAQTDLSPTLRPLFAFRDRLLAIEGLSHTAALADIAAVMRAGSGDLNNHQVGVADVLTGTRALQQAGTYCTGGARTIDQELAVRLSAPGRFDSRVYGFNYIPNSVVSPFSYLGPGQATPMVTDPAAAFSDLTGYLMKAPAPTSRADSPALAPPLGARRGGARVRSARAPAGRRRQAEARRAPRFGARATSQPGAIGPAPRCNTAFDGSAATTSGAGVRQFMDLIRLAFACDLTRIVTFSAPVPQCPELGYPGDQTMHGYAHQSIEGATSCGQMYSPVAAQAMTDLDAWHAGHVAYLLAQLDSVVEGSGTLLDHTVVVWITELATPTHLHYDAFTVLAGGCNGFFAPGRYVRYPQTMPSPLANGPLIGPAHNRLLVSLMQAMGQTDTSFGMTGATAADGTALPFVGPLTELQNV